MLYSSEKRMLRSKTVYKYFCHRNEALDLFSDLWSVEWGEVGEILGMILIQ